MGVMAPQITGLRIVYSIVHLGADQRKYRSSASLAFVWGIHRWPVNSPHKWPVTPTKMQGYIQLLIASIFNWLWSCEKSPIYLASIGPQVWYWNRLSVFRGTPVDGEPISDIVLFPQLCPPENRGHLLNFVSRTLYSIDTLKKETNCIQLWSRAHLNW